LDPANGSDKGGGSGPGVWLLALAILATLALLVLLRRHVLPLRRAHD
jgi:hypothetical protein